MTTHHDVDATLVYDGDCGLCTRCVELMERWIPARPRITAWQWADLPALGLTQAEAEGAVRWVEPGRRNLGGAPAIARLLVLSGGVWALLGRVMQVPPVSWLAAVVYQLVAANRSWLPGGTAACSLPQEQRDALRRRQAGSGDGSAAD